MCREFGMDNDTALSYTDKQANYAKVLTQKFFNGRLQPKDILVFQDLALNPNAMSGLTLANLSDAMAVIEQLHAEGRLDDDVYVRARVGMSNNLVNMSRVSSMNRKDRVVEAKLTADSINRLMRTKKESVADALVAASKEGPRPDAL
jgi:hypothetical protein